MIWIKLSIHPSCCSSVLKCNFFAIHRNRGFLITTKSIRLSSAIGAERATVIKDVTPKPHTTYGRVSDIAKVRGSQLTPIPATSASGADKGQLCGKPVQFTTGEQDIMENKAQRKTKRKIPQTEGLTSLKERPTSCSPWRALGNGRRFIFSHKATGDFSIPTGCIRAAFCTLAISLEMRGWAGHGGLPAACDR